MPLNWSTTQKEGAIHGVKILVYGRAGTGKTTLCGTAPSPLIISAEAGLLSLRSKNIPVILVSSLQDVVDAYLWCQTSARQYGVRTICMDSISEITEKVLATHRAKTKDGRAAYGDMAIEAVSLVKSFRDLAGFHVVVTAKETTTVDNITGATRTGPSTPGRRVGEDLPYLFDIVLQTGISQNQQTGVPFHYLRTSPTPTIEAKDRSGALAPFEAPDLTHIFAKLGV